MNWQDRKYEHISLNYIHEMAYGDMDFVADIINDFLVKIPAYLEDLRKAGVDHDYAQVLFIFHKLKSSIQYLGIHAISDIIKATEPYCRNSPDPDRVNKGIAEVIAIYELAMAELRMVVTTLKD